LSIPRFVQRPRGTYLWKLGFQIHLWTGLLLSVYLFAMGLSGSVLVFRAELEWTSEYARTERSALSSAPVKVGEVLGLVRHLHPQSHIVQIETPTSDRPFYVTTIEYAGERLRLQTDVEGRRTVPWIVGKHPWLDFVARFHTTLFAGPNGRKANGVGATCLLLLSATGLFLWWPGIKQWKRGLFVDFRRRWRRINFDLHHAIGFWSFLALVVWAGTSIYFAWPANVLAAVSRLSPIVNARPPVVTSTSDGERHAIKIENLIAEAERLDPRTTLQTVRFPYGSRAPFEVVMGRPGGSGREYSDTLYFSSWNGAHLATWRYGDNQTWGDWFLWSQVPLHFGTSWGLAAKLLWATAGLSLPGLAITGWIMYWNRFLRHKLR
jgi:uncharacterized iron-regulated membrane protein